MILTTPSGKIFEIKSEIKSVDNGVCSEGFKTMVFPAAIAGAIFQAPIIKG